MNLFMSQIPAGLQPVMSHAERLNEFLRRLERDGRSDGIVGRASELRAVLRAALTDWRAARLSVPETRETLVAYLDEVHRTAAKTLRGSTTLECCQSDDALTLAASPKALSMVLSVALSAAAPVAPASTEQQGWVESPEVLALFHAEEALVEEQARALAGHVPRSCATVDDLRTFGLEGLLEAARRFDPARGVPFAQWARLQIRSAILDGVRLAENRPVNAATIAIAHAPDAQPATPEEMVAAAQELALLPTLLASLPAAERRLLELCYFGGQSLAQAASALGLPPTTAGRLHTRALDALRRLFRPSDKG